jgi:hypothetical protein
MIFLLVAFLLNQRNNYHKLTGVFAEIADIDWGSDLTFQEKVSLLRC